MRMAALPLSRSLAICWERVGFTGRGGGGTELGVSSQIMPRWRVLRRVSSEVKAGEVVEVVLMALVEGSSWMGRKEKESGVSIVRDVFGAIFSGRLWSTVVWRGYGEARL